MKGGVRVLRGGVGVLLEVEQYSRRSLLLAPFSRCANHGLPLHILQDVGTEADRVNREALRRV